MRVLTKKEKEWDSKEVFELIKMKERLKKLIKEKGDSVNHIIFVHELQKILREEK